MDRAGGSRLAGCQAAALLALAATGDASNPVTVTAYS
jgi:hypothetical protein